MTARDEAIEAILDMPKRHMIAKLDAEFFGGVLDAIPPDVLARLAIERGALVQTDKKIVIGRDYQNGRYHNYFAPLYRVVEP